MPRPKLILTFLSIALLLACTDNPTAPTQGDLVGIWDWTESFGGNLGYQDPELCGCTSRYEFTPEFEFAQYFNGEKLDSGTFSVTREYSEFLQRDIDVLYMNDLRFTFEFRGGKIVFFSDWRCLACPDSVFYVRSYVVADE